MAGSNGLEKLYELLAELDQHNYGPNDSVIGSAINHPVNGLQKLAQLLGQDMRTAAGMPDLYDNPNPLQAPSMDEQAQAGLNIAGLAQTGGMAGAPASEGGTLGTTINPFEKLLNSLGMLQKDTGGTYRPAVTSRYGNVAPHEAYDIRKMDKGLKIKDISPKREDLLHHPDLIPTKTAGASVSENVLQPDRFLLDYIHQNKTLQELAQGVHPANTTLGKWTGGAVNKLGGLVTDYNIIPNNKDEYKTVGKLYNLVTEKGIDPNNQADLLAYLKKYDPHKLAWNKGQDIYKGSSIEGKAVYPEKGLSIHQLQEWIDDNIHPKTDAMTFDHNNLKDIIRMYVYKQQNPNWQNDITLF